jgi:hypothetical protein
MSGGLWAPRQPDRRAPFEAVLLLPAVAHAPTVAAARDEATPRLIEGVPRANGHVNDPAVAYCQLCGISMAQRYTRPSSGRSRRSVGEVGLGFIR